MTFITAYEKKLRTRLFFGDEKSRTKQSFAAECNINNIMKKYQKTGVLEHIARHAPTYGDFTPIDYKQAMETVAEANSMFEELPSSVRTRFSNDPAEFLAFVEEPENIDALRDMGLAKPKPPAPPEPKPPAPPEPSPDGPVPPIDP